MRDSDDRDRPRTRKKAKKRSRAAGRGRLPLWIGGAVAGLLLIALVIWG